jgi:hypothetical protein
MVGVSDQQTEQTEYPALAAAVELYQTSLAIGVQVEMEVLVL